MNILVLEDRGSISFCMEETLRDKGHIVFAAYNPIDAQYYMRSKEIDCIIADLNMPLEGLTPEEEEQTLMGLLTGWVWLRNYVFEEKPEMKNKTIIYTEYMKELQNNVSKEELKGIKLLSKRGSTSPAKNLLELLEKIPKWSP